MDTYTAKPGDIYLTQIRGLGGFFIRLGQLVAGDASRYTHAGVVLDDGTAIEADPRGARYFPLDEVERRRIQYRIPLAFTAWDLTDEKRAEIVAAGRRYHGVPYNFLDYLSIGLATFNLRPKWLAHFVNNTGHMICSQLVDQVYQDAGVHIFNDGRLPGDVTPGDLAHVGRIYHFDTNIVVD